MDPFDLRDELGHLVDWVGRLSRLGYGGWKLAQVMVELEEVSYLVALSELVLEGPLVGGFLEGGESDGQLLQ